SSAPITIPLIKSSSVDFAVNIMIGTSLSFLVNLHTSSPEISGNIRSKIIISGLFSFIFFNASIPLEAGMVSHPSFSKYASNTSRIISSSSTIRILVMLNHLFHIISSIKMKKLVIGILTGAVLLGSATFVAAESNGNGFFNFEEMKPYIEEMHPNLSPEQQEEMFNNCHGENGMMQNNTGFRDMMNNI